MLAPAPGPLALPRWATPRDPTADTLGPSVARVAALLGRPFMPWQTAAADVMGEVTWDAAGVMRMRYPLVVLIVPRRAGKTVLTLATSLQRAMLGTDRRVWYTAQSGTDAADTFREEWVPMIRHSALAPYLRVRLSNGSMGLSLPADVGSRVGLFSPTETALHGKDGDYVTIDEAWSPDEVKGAALEAAIRPTMLTRPARQLVLVSAGGTERSTWLLKYRELGRRLVEEGRCAEAGMCFVEFYPAEGADLDDPATWSATHPAVGATIGPEVLAQDYETTERSLFQRGILNVFTSSAGARIIPAEDWNACGTSAVHTWPRRGLTFGYDVSLDHGHGAIVAAWQLPDGTPYAELVRYAPRPSSWLADDAEALRRKYGARLVATTTGPVSTVTAELARRHVPVTTVTGTDYATACQAALDDVTRRAVVVFTSAELDAAAGAVARRDVGDGWVWTRRKSGGDVCPVVALTVALTDARRPAPESPAARMAFA